MYTFALITSSVITLISSTSCLILMLSFSVLDMVQFDCQVVATHRAFSLPSWSICSDISKMASWGGMRTEDRGNGNED